MRDAGRSGDESLESARRAAVRTTRILYVALMGGLAAFAAVVVVIPPAEGPPVDGSGPSLGFLRIIAGVLSASMTIPAILFSGRAVRRSAGGPGLRPAERSQRYVAGKVLVAGLIEGPALIWGIIALLSGDLLHLGGLAFGIFGLWVVFPREDEFRDATGM